MTKAQIEKRINRPTSDKIVQLMQQAGYSWYHLYREPRKGMQFIDGYSLKFYGCKGDPVTLEKLLKANGLDGLNVRKRRWHPSVVSSIVITW